MHLDAGEADRHVVALEAPEQRAVLLDVVGRQAGARERSQLAIGSANSSGRGCCTR
jgi:hypothetical protein